MGLAIFIRSSGLMAPVVHGKPTALLPPLKRFSLPGSDNFIQRSLWPANLHHLIAIKCAHYA